MRKPFWGNTNGNHLSFRTGYTKTSDQVRMDANGFNYQVKNSLYWAQDSDERIKEDIEVANYELCYENVKKLALKRFQYRDGVKSIISRDKFRLGYIAQEVQKIFPKNVEINPMKIYNSSNEVVEEITDCLSIDAEQIHLSLYGAFKHSVNKIEALEAENALLNDKINIISNHLFGSNIT